MSFFKRKSEYHREENAPSADSKQNGHNALHRDSFQSHGHGGVHSPAVSGPPQQHRLPRETHTQSPVQGMSERAPMQPRVAPIPQAHPHEVVPGSKPQLPASPSYPWSTRQLVLTPSAAVGSPPGALVSPFPRYGHSLPPIPTQSGHLLIFGGLVRESVRNDLFALDCHDFSAAPVLATGELPIPRVGHASALVRSVLVVWGGDTKTRIEDEQDEGIYLFNIHTREWTRIIAPGARPRGRYGHAVCMSGNTFYVSGGQVDGKFMNDLWGFDLSTLMVAPTWHLVQPANKAPSPRTGHVLVTYQDKLYIFGGTDGAFHYNDTWCLDLKSRLWSELQCIGYIPVPREGHSAALVDDVMYVFGGRDVGGKDLGDLAAFKFSNRRWYTFQNMGPAPSGRSGHAMAAFGKQIFVLGGDSNAAFAQPRSEDPNVIHVLDTGKIKYPPDPPRNASSSPGNQHAPTSNSNVVNNLETVNPPKEEPPIVQSQTETSTSRDVLNDRDILEPQREIPHTQNEPDGHAIQLGLPLSDKVAEQAIPEHHERSASASRNSVDGSVANTAMPPVRPRRADDNEFASHQYGDSPGSRAGVRNTISRDESTSIAQNGQSQQKLTNRISIAKTLPLSPVSSDEVARRSNGQGSREPPSDAFYYGPRSPTGTAMSARGETPIHAFNRSSESSETMRIARENLVLRAAIEKTLQDGLMPELQDVTTLSVDEASDATTESLLTEVLRLQEQCSNLKIEMLERLEDVVEECKEAQRKRDAAFQEASYLKARLTILETGNPVELGELEREKMQELEEHLTYSNQAKHAMEVEVEQLEAAIKDYTEDLKNLEESCGSAMDRAQLAEETQAAMREELHSVQDRVQELETELRHHKTESLAHSSASQKTQADLARMESELSLHKTERHEHLLVIEQVRSALHTAEERAADASSHHQTALERVASLEADLRLMKAELAENQQAARAASERAEGLEQKARSAATQAEKYRDLTENNLARLLTGTRGIKEGELTARATQPEQSTALVQECTSLRKMLNEAGTQIETAQSALMRNRQELQASDKMRSKLQSELETMRQQRLMDEKALKRLQSIASAGEADSQRLTKEVVEARSRSEMLRRLLADHDISVDDSDKAIMPTDRNPAKSMQDEMASQIAALAASQQEVERLRGLLEEKATDRNGTVATSSEIHPRDQHEQATSVQSLEKRIVEIETMHKKKVQQVEADYQTAVRYVKGTEKVFRRMKDELTKQKNANIALQADLDVAQGTSGTEAGSRTRSAISGRATPTTEGEVSRQQQRLVVQNNELQRLLDGTREELDALRNVCTGREREVEITRRRAGEAEVQIETLKKELEKFHREDGLGGRTLAELEQENADLRQENETLNHQVMLLLADDDSTSQRPRSEVDLSRLKHRQSTGSAHGSEDHTSRNIAAELQEWEENLSPNLRSSQFGPDA